MIVIFFSTGSFGSTVEYVIRAATNEYELDEKEILNDGSMHGFRKMHHLVGEADIEQFLEQYHSLPKSAILTVVYPSKSNRQLQDVWSMIEPVCKPTDKYVLIYINSVEFAEFNHLFATHKVIPNTGIDNFYQGIDIAQTVSRWNPAYKTFADMQPWEFREWQSLLTFDERINVGDKLDNRFLKISTQEILDQPYDSFEKIIDWCGLTRNSMDLKSFASEWRQAQQYVLDEHRLVLELVDATIANISMSIPDNLSIWAEAIVQRRLRHAGYEIRCHGLNKFPSNTTMLHELLYQTNLHTGQTI